MSKTAKATRSQKSCAKRPIGERNGTIEDLAATKFKKWPANFPTSKIDERMNECASSITFAVAVMQKSREELITLHGEMPHDLMRKLYEDFEVTAATLAEIAEVMRCASLRILASGAARLERGQSLNDARH